MFWKTITCEMVRRELIAYRDGELPERDRTRVTNHLSTCPACTREETQLARVSQLFANLERITPSPDFVATFRNRLAQEDQVEQESLFAQWWREWIGRWQLAPALAAVASLLIFISYLLSGRITPQAPTMPEVPGQIVAEKSALPTSEVPKQVAAEPGLFVDYKMIADLDKFAHLDEIASVQAPQKPETAVANEKDLPPALLENPSLFMQYPLLQKMERLQNMDAVLALPTGEGAQRRG